HRGRGGQDRARAVGPVAGDGADGAGHGGCEADVDPPDDRGRAATERSARRPDEGVMRGVLDGAASVMLRAMGTDVRLDGLGAERVAAEIVRLESMMTRFRPSPLTDLNARGRLSHPPAELVAALRWSKEAARVSAGLVTPLVLRALEHHGYRRSWPDVDAPGSAATPGAPDPAGAAGGSGSCIPAGSPPPVPGLDALVVRDDEVLLAPGAGVDLGGTAKSWIVEHAASRFVGPFVADAG